jgi:hypothetical protein
MAVLPANARVTPLSAVAKALADAALSIEVQPTCWDCWVLPDHSIEVAAIDPPWRFRRAFHTAVLWNALI